jgi:hypothetical protein
MSDFVEKKVCPHCAETIKPAAKVCPHCRYWQKTWSLYNAKLLGVFGLAVLAVYSVIMGVFFDSMFEKGHDFAEHRNQIRVVTSTMNFSQTDKEPYITTVGLLTNSSEFAWKEVHLEAQYFDDNGKLIDTGIERNFEVVVMPHAEVAFRIRTLADKPESSYVSHKIFVRTAQDAANRF